MVYFSHFCLVNASFDVIFRETVCNYISYYITIILKLSYNIISLTNRWYKGF